MIDFTDPDPLRLALLARTREATQRAIDALDPLDPGSWQARSDLITSGASEWAPWFQALKEAGGGRPVRLAGGPSPEGSNQLRGTQGREFGHGIRAMEASAQPQSTWMREQGRNDRRRQLASLDALRAAGNLPSRT